MVHPLGPGAQPRLPNNDLSGLQSAAFCCKPESSFSQLSRAPPFLWHTGPSVGAPCTYDWGGQLYEIYWVRPGYTYLTAITGLRGPLFQSTLPSNCFSPFLFHSPPPFIQFCVINSSFLFPLLSFLLCLFFFVYFFFHFMSLCLCLPVYHSSPVPLGLFSYISILHFIISLPTPFSVPHFPFPFLFIFLHFLVSFSFYSLFYFSLLFIFISFLSNYSFPSLFLFLTSSS
jgi:hypothetical protein